MSRHQPLRAVAVAATVLALSVLAACSGSSGSDGGDAAPTTKAKTTTRPVAATTGATDATASTDAPTTTEVATTTEAAAATPDPCTLVTQAEAEKLVSLKLQDPVKAGGADDSLCQRSADPNGPAAQVQVFAGDGAKKSYDIDHDQLQHTFTTLTGVGDEAYLEDDNVFLRKGTVWVQVNIVDLDKTEDEIKAGLQALAPTIASRIP